MRIGTHREYFALRVSSAPGAGLRTTLPSEWHPPLVLPEEWHPPMVLPSTSDPPEAVPPADAAAPSGPSEEEVTRQQEDVLGTDQEIPKGAGAGSLALPDELRSPPSGTDIPGDSSGDGGSFPSRDDGEVDSDEGTQGSDDVDSNAGAEDSSAGDVDSSSGTESNDTSPDGRDDSDTGRSEGD